MSDAVRGVVWYEKYRPTSLDGLALDPAIRGELDSYVAAGEIPHMLMVGPPGSGKTTIARILTATLDCQVLALNASTERGIDVVRTKIGSFITSLLGTRWNIVFLDEADALTADAQTALRNMMESHSDRSRFIMTANRGHKIIAPIQSRCQLLTLGRPPLAERYRVLQAVLAAESIEADPKIVLGYAEKYLDMRRMLYAAQKAFLGSGTLTPAAADRSVSGAEIFQAITAGQWGTLRRIATDADFDAQQGLRELFWVIPDDHAHAGFLRHVVGRGVHETGFTPDPVVLFLAVCAEAMNGLAHGE